MRRFVVAVTVVAGCVACGSGGSDVDSSSTTSVVVSSPSVTSSAPTVSATSSSPEVAVPADRKLPPYGQMCSDLRQVFQLGGGDEAAAQFIATVEASSELSAAGVRWADLSSGEQSEFKRTVYAAANDEC